MWVSRKYVEMLERELDYYRAFAERERARADRLHDQLLQDRGCLPATETTLQAQEKAQSSLDEALDMQRRQLTEMFAEQLDQLPTTEDSTEADTIESLGTEVGAMLGYMPEKAA